MVSAAAAEAPAPSVDSTWGMRLLPTILSLTAGSMDVISFLGLGGLFTAHITGNLVILAAHLVNGGSAPVALLLSVPVFVAGLGVTRVVAAALEAIGVATLRPLLLLQFVLLVGFLVLCMMAGPRVDPSAPIAVVAGMFGVLAMAVQNALVQISLRGAPSTAVMTTNLTRFMMDLGEVLFGRNEAGVTAARARAVHTLPAIVGFTVGVGLGSASETEFGLLALVLPTGLALLAVALALVRA
jgi:uncharacterized membrane protein YoaK (UPF0700 family)